MSEGNGQAGREAILEYVRKATGNPKEALSDDEPITKHIGDFFDACELSMFLEDRFPEHTDRIVEVMKQVGLDESQTDYRPETATLKTYGDFYAALDCVE